MVKLSSQAVKLAGSKNLCLAGGVPLIVWQIVLF